MRFTITLNANIHASHEGPMTEGDNDSRTLAFEVEAETKHDALMKLGRALSSIANKRGSEVAYESPIPGHPSSVRVNPTILCGGAWETVVEVRRVLHEGRPVTEFRTQGDDASLVRLEPGSTYAFEVKV
jgi:hypothetical protein